MNTEAVTSEERTEDLTRRKLLVRGGIVSAGALGAGLISACGASESQSATAATGKRVRVAIAAVGFPGVPIFVRVKNGAIQAGKDINGLSSDYRETTSGKLDVNEFNRLTEAIIASKPDGLATYVIDPTAQVPTLKGAVAAGIPVALMLAGRDVVEKVGAIGYWGVDVESASAEAARRMQQAGATNVIVVNQAPAVPDVNLRFVSFKKAFEAGGGKVRQIVVDESNPTDMRGRTKAALLSTSGVNGIYALASSSAEAAMLAAQDVGKLGELRIANWDLSIKVLQAITDGNILFAQDQQPFLTVHNAVTGLFLFKRYGMGPAAPVDTGPSFVTKANAPSVIPLVERAIR